MTLSIDRATDAALPAAASLSDAAGWDVGERDWRRFFRSSAATVLVGRRDDDAVGTATLVTYEGRDGPPVAWVGMILVHPEERRQGYGTALFEAAVERAPEDALVGLDANEMGYEVYADTGYHDVCTVTQWRGGLDVSVADPAPEADVAAVLARDDVAVDRGPFLRELVGEDDVRAVATDEGYAVARPVGDAWQVGPLLASTARERDRLLAGLALDGEVIVNAVRDDLSSVGLSRARSLTRMCDRPVDELLSAPPVVSVGGFAWG